jgi:hypothetical protein
LKLWLHVAGPHEIASFVANYIPGYTLPRAVSICQSCVALQKDSAAMAVIAEHGPEVAHDVLASFIGLNGGFAPLSAF